MHAPIKEQFMHAIEHAILTTVLTVANNAEDTIMTRMRMTTRDKPSLVRIFLFLNESSSVRQ